MTLPELQAETGIGKDHPYDCKRRLSSAKNCTEDGAIKVNNRELKINVNNRQLKAVGHFQYLGRVLTRDGYCTREIIAIAKEAFNRQMSLLSSKLNIELKKKLVRCNVWSIALYDS